MYLCHLHLPVSSYSDSLSHPNDMWSSLGQHLMSSAISLSKHLSWWLSLDFTHVATYTQATCWGKVQWTWGRDWNSAHHFASLEYTINHPHPHPHLHLHHHHQHHHITLNFILITSSSNHRIIESSTGKSLSKQMTQAEARSNIDHQGLRSRRCES